MVRYGNDAQSAGTHEGGGWVGKAGGRQAGGSSAPEGRQVHVLQAAGTGGTRQAEAVQEGMGRTAVARGEATCSAAVRQHASATMSPVGPEAKRNPLREINVGEKGDNNSQKAKNEEA